MNIQQGNLQNKNKISYPFSYIVQVHKIKKGTEKKQERKKQINKQKKEKEIQDQIYFQKSQTRVKEEQRRDNKHRRRQYEQMNSYNFIHNIYKSYSIGAALEARIPQSFSKEDEGEQMDIEQSSNESNEQTKLKNVMLLYKQNSIEIWRQNSKSKGYLENVSEIGVYCNIMKVIVIKSSDASPRGDVIFILSEDLSFRFFHLNLKGEIDILYQGILQNEDQEQIRDISLAFFSQISTTAKTNQTEFNCIIGVYAYYKCMNIISFNQTGGNIKHIHQSQIKIPSIMQNIHSITPILQTKSNSHLLAFYYSNQKEQKNTYAQFEIENISDHSSVFKLIQGKKFCFTHQTNGDNFYALEFGNQGTIFFTDNKVQFYSYSDKTVVDFVIPFPNQVICHSHLKDNMYFIATQDSSFQSSLFLVNIIVGSRSLDIKYLGRISPPTSIIKLPEQHIFITSLDDDCKVIKIHDKYFQSLDSYLEVKLKLSNLSSIYNMKLLESDFNQRLIITSPQKEHSMNIFQKGMSLISKGEIKFNTPIKEMMVIHKNHLIIGFDNSCLLLKLDEEKGQFRVIMHLNQGLLNCFALDEDNDQNRDKKLICIVSATSIQLIDIVSTNVFAKLDFTDRRIILSTNNKNILITADSTNQLLAYNFNGNNINQVEGFKFQSRNCFSAITSLGNYVAAAEWFQSFVTLVDINDSNKTFRIDIPLQKVVRSIIFHEDNKILMGYSDGIITLVYYSIDTSTNTITTTNLKNMVIGYKPVKFRSLQLFSSYCSSSTPLSISCISNEVSILSLRKVDESYQRYQKTYFNIQDVNQIDEIEINGTPYLVMAKKNCLQIGGIEVSQKFHIYNFGKDVQEQNQFRCQTELVEVVRNMSVSVSIIENEEEDAIGSNILLHSIKNQDLLDQIKLNGLCVYALLSVNDYFFIGGRSSLNEHQGFLYTYLVDNENKILLVEKHEYKIPIMHISRYSDISISIILGHDSFKVYQISYPNSSDYSILKSNTSQKFLQEALTQSNLSLTAISMDCNNKNQIVVADRMRGIQLFQEVNKKAMIVAKSPFPVISTNAKFLGDDNIVFCDKDSNILILRQNELAENDLEKIKLLVLSSINNGDIIQTSLRRQISTKDVKDKYISTHGFEQVIYGTKKGWIGVVMTLNEQAYTILQDLQESILQRHKCPLNFDYNKWKSIKNIPCSKSEKSNFIDGDIIFKVLKMNQQQLVNVLDGMSAIPKPSIAEIEQLIENLDLLIF